jgi:hypothetical protein
VRVALCFWFRWVWCCSALANSQIALNRSCIFLYYKVTYTAFNSKASDMTDQSAAPTEPVAPHQNAPQQGAPHPLRSVYTSNFPRLLDQLGISLVVTTYQAGKVILVRKEGERAEDAGLNTHFVAYQKPMGLAADEARIAVGARIGAGHTGDRRRETGHVADRGDAARFHVRHRLCGAAGFHRLVAIARKCGVQRHSVSRAASRAHLRRVGGVNIQTGETVAFLRFEEGAQGIFALQAIPARFPAVLDWNDEQLKTSYALPDAALAEVKR